MCTSGITPHQVGLWKVSENLRVHPCLRQYATDDGNMQNGVDPRACNTGPGFETSLCLVCARVCVLGKVGSR